MQTSDISQVNEKTFSSHMSIHFWNDLGAAACRAINTRYKRYVSIMMNV